MRMKNENEIDTDAAAGAAASAAAPGFTTVFTVVSRDAAAEAAAPAAATSVSIACSFFISHLSFLLFNFDFLVDFARDGTTRNRTQSPAWTLTLFGVHLKTFPSESQHQRTYE